MNSKSIFINRKNKVRSGFKILLVFIAIMIVAALLGLAYGVFVAIAHRGNPNESIAILQNSKYVYQFIQEISFIIVPIFSWKIIEKRSLENIGYVKSKASIGSFLGGLIFGAVSISAVLVILICFGNVTLSSSLFQPNFTKAAYIDLFFYTSVGFAEETFFRGYCMGSIAESNNKWTAAIISALLFSVAHAANPNVKPLFFINVFLVGLLFSYMFIKSKNIWLPIGYHAMWDYFEGNVWGLPDSGIVVDGIYKTKVIHSNIINGGLVGPEGGLAVTIVILLGFIIIKGLYKENHNV